MRPIPFLFLFAVLFALAAAGRSILLPPFHQPEGVTHAAGSLFFAGDIRTGAIRLVDTATRLVTTAVPPQVNRSSIGLFFARRRGLLLAAGGGSIFGLSGALYAYDAATGASLAACETGPGSFVNDVAADSTFAYFTDSARGVLYQLDLRRVSECRTRRIRLPRPAFRPEQGAFKANGIALFRGGLLVTNGPEATIYFVDLRNGNAAHRVLPVGSLPNQDGLELQTRGRGVLLYVVQNALETVAVLRLKMRKRRVSARVIRRIRSRSFQFPTTVAVAGRTLVAANSRFDEITPNDEPAAGDRFSVSVLTL